MSKYIVTKNPSADTRTCDVSQVTSEQLLAASKSHIDDVDLIMHSLSLEIFKRGKEHDHTKISHHDEFYRDFKVSFATQDWYKMHKTTERHHLQSPDGVPDDVNLIDVLECIVDCVAAGLARSGKVRPIEIPTEVLLKAVENTAKMIAGETEIVEEAGIIF